MKLATRIILLAVLIIPGRTNIGFSQVNVNNLYCLGNGRMAAYETDADIIQLFGPPYSTPSLLSIKLNKKAVNVKNNRIKRTAIWEHKLTRDGKSIGTITDFIDTQLPVFVRKIVLEDSISFTMHIEKKARIIENTVTYQNQKNNINRALLIESPRGVPFYNDYPVPFKQYMQIAGSKTVNISKINDESYTIHCAPGTGYIYIIGGPLYPDCIANTKAALSIHYNMMFARTAEWWKKFSERKRDFRRLIPDNFPLKNKLLQTIDDVSIALKTQQSKQGAIIAGSNFHLGYVRDQYGASRCLLALGYYEEAKAIMNFYWNIWKRKGLLHNAQGIGVDAFHYAENDEVEITSYLIIQAFDYYKKTKDSLFIRKIFPMLEWAWNLSKTRLIKNMEPFNGDETYIAGGIFPRSHIIDGSAEATLLFIVSGKAILHWIERNKTWETGRIEKNKKLLRKVRSDYRKNFFADGHLYCNNPSRSIGVSLSPFRYGVCEGQFEGCEYFSWTRKNKHNRYLCPVCFSKEEGRNLPKAPPKQYLLHSVSLIPLYIGSDMFTPLEVETMIDSIVSTFNQTGKLPSKRGGNITVGYDYGLLLYNLTRLRNASAMEVYKQMLSVVDKTGTWSEYYFDGKAMGTRYRPWESGINLEAAILYALSFSKK